MYLSSRLFGHVVRGTFVYYARIEQIEWISLFGVVYRRPKIIVQLDLVLKGVVWIHPAVIIVVVQLDEVEDIAN